MQVQVIVKELNHMLANETLRFQDTEHLFNRVIEEINSNLNAIYPTMTEFLTQSDITGDYNVFPDRYIRSVLIPGAAFYFYQEDEEGEYVASSFGATYRQNMFHMVRDHMMKVPEKYQSDNEGYVTMSKGMFGAGVGISLTDFCE